MAHRPSFRKIDILSNLVKMHLSHLLLLTGALAVSAHPSGHAHLHRSAHEQRGESKFFKAVHKAIPIPTPSAAAAPAPSAAPSAAPAKASPTAAAFKAASVDSSDDSSATFKAFCGSTGNSKRVTEAQVMYTGNTGTGNGCSWGSNMMVVDNSLKEKYTYAQTYTNAANTAYEVRCFNKMGPDGALTGSFSANGGGQLVFTLKPGETKTVVADKNTQGVCAFAASSVPTTSFGQYAGNWVEFDFGNTSNGGWSGADCSSLVAQHYDMDVPGCKVCNGATSYCSTIKAGGIGDNAYTKGMEAEDGVGLNLAAGNVRLTVTVG
ncbi:hypothetical protein B0T17DRAFT_615956 [Bombardia bombarda]|uniref:Allergen Asp f 4 n=1 Tax=Bombardia bombarda TaxID=252184 RepID=A0AA40C9P7_9PEZI|nr:hypothetical protein B0T17DRAFT_615956 [Bombardia bombarda]